MKKIKYIILIILGVIVLLSSCSMFPSEVTRVLFFDSICWEDDSHILMYTVVKKWVNTTILSITGESGHWDWAQGEIWRINVFTGEKELLLREEGDYYTRQSNTVKIDILGDKKLISLDGNAYIMEGKSADWQEIPGIYEAEWVNENEIVGISEEAQALVKYDLQTETVTNEYYTVVTGAKRNYLSYDPISNDCMITIGSKSLILFDNMEFKEQFSIVQDSFIDLDSNIFVCLDFDKPFCLSNNEKVIQISKYYPDGLDFYNYIMELDSNSMVSLLIEFDNSNIIPNLSMDKFLIPSYISGESIMNGLILYNKDKTVINTIIFPMDELE